MCLVLRPGPCCQFVHSRLNDSVPFALAILAGLAHEQRGMFLVRRLSDTSSRGVHLCMQCIGVWAYSIDVVRNVCVVVGLDVRE